MQPIVRWALDTNTGSHLRLRLLNKGDTMPGNENGLDSDKGQSEELPRRGPAGDVQPNDDDVDPRTRGGQSQEDVEDRPSVGTVKPEDYPVADRADSQP